MYIFIKVHMRLEFSPLQRYTLTYQHSKRIAFTTNMNMRPCAYQHMRKELYTYHDGEMMIEIIMNWYREKEGRGEMERRREEGRWKEEGRITTIIIDSRKLSESLSTAISQVINITLKWILWNYSLNTTLRHTNQSEFLDI